MEGPETRDVVVELPLERELYELVCLEVANDSNPFDSVEAWLRMQVSQRLSTIHNNQYRSTVRPPVGVPEEVAERLLLRAEFARQTGSKYPWWDSVGEFIDVEPTLVLEDTDEELREQFGS